MGREKRSFLLVFALETPFRPGWGRGVSAAFHSFSPEPPGPLGTLARRSSSRRRLLARLIWAFCKMGSRFACFSISVGNDFWESNSVPLLEL